MAGTPSISADSCVHSEDLREDVRKRLKIVHCAGLRLVVNATAGVHVKGAFNELRQNRSMVACYKLDVGCT
jgi:hypothetical protein